MKQQSTTRFAEGQIAQFIQYHQIRVDEPMGTASLLVSPVPMR